MDNNERLKFMREWLKELEGCYPKDTYIYREDDKCMRKKIECLGWAIKQCRKNVDRKADKERSYW